MVRRSADYGGITPLDGHYVSRVEDREPKRQMIDGANEVPFLITARELQGRKRERRKKHNAPRPFPTALRLLVPLAEKGDAAARHLLGTLYYAAVGLSEDKAEAARWFRKAAQQGNVDSMLSLGRLYDLGGKGVAEDKAEAAKWYRRAAENGNADAQFELGSRQLTPHSTPYRDGARKSPKRPTVLE